MLRITLSKAGEPPRTSAFDKREITVGRTPSNDVIIVEPGVSSHHARILYMDGELTLIDLESTNGTFVGGQRIQGPRILRPGDEVYICAHRLQFDFAEAGPRPQKANEAPPASVPPAVPRMRSPPPELPPILSPLPAPVSSPSPVAPVPELVPTPSLGVPSSARGIGAPAPIDSASNVPTMPPMISSAGREPEPRQPPAASAQPKPGGTLTPNGRGQAPPPSLPPPAPLPVHRVAQAPRTPISDPPQVHAPSEGPPRTYAQVFAAVCGQLGATGELPPTDDQTRAVARTEARKRLGSVAPAQADVDGWADRIAAEVCGLGPLSTLLGDPKVRALFVHGPEHRVTVRRDGAPAGLEGPAFSCAQAIEVAVRRLTGEAFDAEHPFVDARLPSGAAVCAVHESVSVQGPVVELSIPAVAEPRWSLEMLLQARALTPAIANLLTACVYGGLNIVICAGPGAQAFGLVAALADAAPPECRQLVVRPRYEPGLLPDGAVVLEGRRCAGSPGSTVMQTLVRTALTLSPDRLLVHEMTGAEAVDVFAAMGRGLQGTVVSTRAGSAAEGLSRLATLVGLAGDSANHVTRTIHVAQSVELLITLARFPDGHTRVTQVAEACLSPSGAPRAIDLVTIDPYTRNWTHTGVTPTFFAELQRRGIAVDMGG